MLITFKHKPYNSYFEFSSKWILTKIQIWLFCLVVVVGGGGGGGNVQDQGIKERGEQGKQSNNSHEWHTLYNSFALNFC